MTTDDWGRIGKDIEVLATLFNLLLWLLYYLNPAFKTYLAI